ncbi:MAG: DUF4041 domain-containing protein [Colwellia sp.]
MEMFWMILAATFGLTTIILFIILKVKKSKGKRLDETLNGLSKSIKEKETELSQRKQELNHLIELEKGECELKDRVVQGRITLESIKSELSEMMAQKDETSDLLDGYKNDISIYEPINDLVNVGFFEEPEYLFETSERFKEEIKLLRDAQKELIKKKAAIEVPETIALTSNKSYTKRIVDGQVKLMLKAFNVECDILMSMVKASNFAKILERIERVATDLEKSAISLKCGFSQGYVKLKFDECELQYQYKLRDQQEKEEQAAIKEQMREEQKAIREYERVLVKAQKEELLYRDALDAARKELELAGNKDKDELNNRIALLESQLKEAEESEKRAKSMAEQTRRGHVYVISNIGSFGEGIYKIGLTRRLEPMDRVKELGDASVPFTFDVHAMIYSDDAPALESQLHREFTNHRVNQVNHRKEFFTLDLHAIKSKAIEITGSELDFTMTALAEDYYETKKLKG